MVHPNFIKYLRTKQQILEEIQKLRCSGPPYYIKKRSYVYQVCVLKEHHLINVSFKRVTQINHHEDVGNVIGID